MTMKDHFMLLARYNQWMNAKVYGAAARLDPAALHADKGAFFGSVFDTLAHILFADTIWMMRVGDHPAAFRSLHPLAGAVHPYSLDQPMHADLASLTLARQRMDRILIDLTTEADDDAYAQSFTYANRAGERFVDPLGHVMLHVFNHQTHHRGQVTTLLTQAGIDVGVTDLVAMIREPSSS